MKWFIKRIAIVLGCLLLPIIGMGQSTKKKMKPVYSYEDAIEKSEAALKSQQFGLAIDYLFAAQAYQKDSSQVIRNKVLMVFGEIEKLRLKSDRTARELRLSQVSLQDTIAYLDSIRMELDSSLLAEKEATALAFKKEQEAINARDSLILAKNEAVENLEKAVLLISAVDYYNDRFALAFRADEYFFIDNQGNEVNVFGKWKNAKLFDQYGLAEVIGLDDNENYIVDTLGSCMKVSYRVPKADESKSKIEALDLKYNIDNIRLYEIPKDLKLLIIRGSGIDKVDAPKEDVTSIAKKKKRKKDDDLEVIEGRKVYNPELGWRLSQGDIQIPQEISSFQKLMYLQLRDLRSKSVPTSISKLENLLVLDLRGNQLESLPLGLKQLEQLERLFLNDNKFTRIPTSIFKLKRITRLELRNNQIKDIPEEIIELQELQQLDLGNNKLSGFPFELTKLAKLEELYLDSNDIEELPEKIKNLTHLKILDLRSNPITTDEREKIIAYLPNTIIYF
ncbi:MAG: leucine-rich repeat domain-containing protein [Bacteroidota bacterium]